MHKSAYIRARIEPDLKARAEAVFNELGVTPSQVINMLYTQVSKQRKIPLNLHLPNETTVQAIQETREGKDIKTAKDADDLFKQLGI